jgi:hypothetical protein
MRNKASEILISFLKRENTLWDFSRCRYSFFYIDSCRGVRSSKSHGHAFLNLLPFSFALPSLPLHPLPPDMNQTQYFSTGTLPPEHIGPRMRSGLNVPCS